MMFILSKPVVYSILLLGFSTTGTARSLPEVTSRSRSMTMSTSRNAASTPTATQALVSPTTAAATPAHTPQHSSSTSGVTVATVGAILGAMVVLLLLALLLALVLRNHKKKRYQKMLEQATSAKNGSLTAIVVTKEFGSESRSISMNSMESDTKSVRFEMEKGG